MNQVVCTLGEIGLVPVVKINDASKAAPLADALCRGGLPCAEVTFRTDAAKESIRSMLDARPGMLVGAGTVLTVEQVDSAIEAGAKFLVSPGFNPTVVDYCLTMGYPIIPGISSPSELEQCLQHGLDVVKFFPAENCGGLKFIKALSGPYANVRFMPTGGINLDILTDYLSDPHILACGGTWMVSSALIDSGEFAEIERLSRNAVSAILGIKLAHVGVNTENESEARAAANLVCSLFDLELRDGASVFAGTSVEFLKTPYLGRHGHIAFSTRDLDRAVASFRRRGISFNEESAKYLADGRLNAIYFADEVAGFAVHLVRA